MEFTLPRRRALLALGIVLVCLSACTGNPEARKQRFALSGDRYFAEGKYLEASLEYQNAVQIDARFGPARKRLADCYARLNQPTRALAEYVRAADLLPDDEAVQMTAGRYLLAARHFDDAKARAETVLARRPSDVQAHVLLGNALAGLREIDEAISEIEEAIQLDPARGATYADLGILEMSRGRTEPAEAAFRRSVELDAKWVPGHLALANLYWARGRLPESERSLRAALALEPSNPIANRAMALFLMAGKRGAEAEPFVKVLAASGSAPFALTDYYLLENRTAEAIRQLEQLRTQSTTADAAARRLARAYAQRGNLADAHRVVDELLERDQKAAAPLLLKGRLLAAEGKRDQAIAKLQAAAQVDPNSAAIQFSLGRAYAARGDFDAAREAYTEVLKLNPRAASAQVQLATLDLVGGRAKSSVQLAREAVRTEPESTEAQIALIRGLIAEGDLAGAEKLLAPLLAAHPDLPAAHVQRALASGAAKDPASARRSFERALSLSPDLTEAVEGLVALDLSAGNVGAARARIDAHVKQQPRSPALRLIAARAAAAAKDLAAAESHLRQVLEIDPGFQPGYVMLGQLYIAQGKLDAAKREFEALAPRQVKPVAALTMLGMISQIQRDQLRAEQYFEQVIDLDPRAPIAANNLAWMYAERGEHLDRALQLALAGLETEKRRPEMHDTLGWVYYKKEIPERAIPAFRESIRLAPRNPVYHYHLGLAQIQGGESKAARRSLERALELGPFEEAAAARRLLAEVPPASASAK